MSEQRDWNIRDLLEWTTDFFTRRSIPSARLDAEVLLAHALGQTRLWLYLNFGKVVPAETLAAYRDLVKRRGTRIPIAYLVGEKEFYGLRIAVNPHVLVPRPETEILVEHVAGKLLTNRLEVPLRIADIGTGSGAIAVALVHALAPPPVYVTATDISQEALDVAAQNAETHGFDSLITFRQGDLCGALTWGDTYHAVVSNPPYLSTAELSGLEPEVSVHEPKRALLGGEDGLTALRAIVEQTPEYLEPNGWLALEVGAGQAPTVAELIRETGVFREPEIVRDYSGVERIVLAQKQP